MTVKMPIEEDGSAGWALFFKQLWSFCGVGLMVSVGYMDPGNWATDLEGGAKYEYTLLFVVFLSNLMAVVLQHLALKLGVAAGKDLAQMCRIQYGYYWNITLWLLAEVSIAACDVAEVIGSAVALQLLFNIPLFFGVLLTAADVLVILFIEQKNFRMLELVVGSLILLISGCFAYELWLSSPEWGAVLYGILPQASLVTDKRQLLIGVGILGATVMPHNLYLHSAIVQTRAYARTTRYKKRAIKIATIDSTIALCFAFFVNAAILILSASTFHGTKNQDVTEIADAFRLLSPTLGAVGASTIFAIALLGFVPSLVVLLSGSGQNSTITGTLAGQIIMEGFVNIRLRPWVRRLMTRGLAIIPAAFIAAVAGEHGVGRLLLFSQVVLSLQLSFAVVPLVMFTADRKVVGREFVNSRALNWVSLIITLAIMGLNGFLVVQSLIDFWHGKVPSM